MANGAITPNRSSTNAGGSELSLSAASTAAMTAWRGTPRRSTPWVSESPIATSRWAGSSGAVERSTATPTGTSRVALLTGGAATSVTMTSVRRCVGVQQFCGKSLADLTSFLARGGSARARIIARPDRPNRADFLCWTPTTNCAPKLRVCNARTDGVGRSMMTSATGAADGRVATVEASPLSSIRS